MQSGELVELAAVVARQGPALLSARDGFRVVGIEEYWAASKCRFDRWGRSLGRVRRGEQPIFDDRSGTVRGLVEEILGGEVLTRVWTALVSAFDREHSLQDNEIVVRSVYIGHMEMRQRVLQMLATGTEIDTAEAVTFNRLRRRAELWTDMLLAPLAAAHAVGEFAFEAPRLRQLTADMRAPAGAPSDAPDPTALYQASLHSAVGLAFSDPAPNADLNARIAGAILGAFPMEQFDSCGVLRSLWMMRLAHTADDTQRLLDELFHNETAAPRLPSSRRFG